MKFDIHAVQALERVIAEGSFARAAEKLNRTQSAVSYQIKKLEQSLGVPLLDRSSYRTRLTPEGSAILEEGRNLLAQAKYIESLAEQFAQGWEARLEVVIDGILPMEPIMQALKVMADESVPTRIQVKVEFLGGVQYRFEKDEADIMLVKDYRPDPLLAAIPLGEIESILVAARDHPLTAMEEADRRTLHEYVELTIHDSSEQGESGLDQKMFGGDRVFYLSDFNCKKEALVMGLGFGWMPEFLIRKELRNGTLQEVRYREGSRYSFTPMLVHRTPRPLGKAGTRFRELIMESGGMAG